MFAPILLAFFSKTFYICVSASLSVRTIKRKPLIQKNQF